MTKALFPTLARANTFIKSLGQLSPQKQLRAEAIRALAEQIDTARGSKTGTQSMAIPNLVRQLENSMVEIMKPDSDEDAFLTDPFLRRIFTDPETGIDARVATHEGSSRNRR